MPRMLLSCEPQSLPTLIVSRANVGHVMSDSESVGRVLGEQNHETMEHLAQVIAVGQNNSEKDSLPCMLNTLRKMTDRGWRRTRAYPRSCIDGCNIRV